MLCDHCLSDLTKLSIFYFTVKFFFFFLNFLVYLNFSMVARRWSEYVLSFERAERKLMEFHVMQLQDIKAREKVWRVFVIIMILAFGELASKFSFISLITRMNNFMTFRSIFIFFNVAVEHNLSIATGVFLSKSCWNVRSAEEAYFRQSFTEFFSTFTFNIYLGLFAQIVNVFW